MNKIKESILKNICYTELVYGRINKKLKRSLSHREIEQLLLKTIEATPEMFFEEKGKNIYVSNEETGIRITINKHNYRVITVDTIKK